MFTARFCRFAETGGLIISAMVWVMACSTSAEQRTGLDGGSDGPNEGQSDAIADDAAAAADASSGVNECAAQLVAAGFHTCVRSLDGRIWCWGGNGHGQLTGSDLAESVPIPRAVSGLRAPARYVAVGGANTCAVLADESVWCWGDNSSGQLGIGTITGVEPVPSQITGLDGQVVSIDIESGYDPMDNSEEPETRVSLACAVKADGTLWCWGANSRGQLGDGQLEGSPVPSPTRVDALGSDVIAVSVSALSACALKANGKVWCWGYNVYGQAGDGTTSDVRLPVEVVGLDNVVEVANGGSHRCALDASSRVWCWGKNVSGECGVGSPSKPDRVPVPAQVTIPYGKPVHVAASAGTTCVLLEDGTISCWGNNSQGQLGNGTVLNTMPYGTTSPTQVLGLSGVESVACGGATCASTHEAVWCWGDNYYGELGNGTTSTDGGVPTPAKVLHYCP